MKWEQYGVQKALAKELIKCGFKTPTKIQQEALKHLPERKDMLIAARTGEGKTLTYAIPILNAFVSGCDQSPLGLILAPTRELAIQIQEHIMAVGKGVGFRSAVVVGGLSAAKQYRVLSKGKPHVVVATPGRLWDLMSEGQVDFLRSLNSVKFVIIDEGDRMVESGHFRELQNILLY